MKPQLAQKIIPLRAHTRVRERARTAATGMAESVDRVTAGVSLATEASKLIDHINEEAQRVMVTVSEMGAALREQASTSVSIAGSVETVARIRERNTALAGQGAIESHAASLKIAISRFRV